MPVATTCPHCRAVYNLADHQRGRTVRCKKCQGAIVVGKGAAPPSEEKTKAPAAGKRPPQRKPEKEPPRRKKRGGNRALLVGLIVGGVSLVLLCGGVLAFLVLTGKLGNRTPDMLVDVSGPWPEPMGFPPVMGNVDHSAYVIVRIAGANDEYTHDDVCERLSALTDSRYAASTGAQQGDRLAIRLSPVKDPKAFADRIDFATVRSVQGRTITIVARKVEGPPPGADDVALALYRLKAPRTASRKKAALLLKGKDLDKRRQELLRTPDPRQAEVLRALGAAVDEPERFAREEIYQALGVWGTKETVPVLIKELQKEDSRNIAIQALGRIKDPGACEAIAVYLDNPPNRWSVCEALKSIGPAAEPFALKHLNRADQGQCLLVCSVLEKIGGPASIPALEKLTTDIDTAIAGQAKASLEVLRKQK